MHRSLKKGIYSVDRGPYKAFDKFTVSYIYIQLFRCCLHRCRYLHISQKWTKSSRIAQKSQTWCAGDVLLAHDGKAGGHDLIERGGTAGDFGGTAGHRSRQRLVRVEFFV